ncbi:MAG: MmcQ/YjbR family DNA-binding protein [Clostridia bacterium]|nr:MmcQ/YjbR family DNA-binding protein [Clostridia bacterium]
MTREEFEAFVYDRYNVKADYPFEEDFVTGVFRHGDSGKWFAIAMNISRSRLGLSGEGSVDVVNMKCAPEVIESIAGVEPGIYPAYHMNKTHWLTVALDGSCDDATVEWLLGISYDLTRTKIKAKKRGVDD